MVVALGLSAASFAQVTATNMVDAAKDKQNELIKQLKSKELDKIEWGDAEKQQQFLVSGIVNFTNSKEKTVSIKQNDKIKDVCNTIKNNKGDLILQSFECGTLVSSTPQPVYKRDRNGEIKIKKGVKKIKNGMFEVDFKISQCHTVLVEKKSGKKFEATYDVTMTWVVPIKGAESKPLKQRIGEVKLKSIKATPASNEAVLRANADKEVERLIRNWYAQNANGTSFFAKEANEGDELISARPDGNVAGIRISGPLKKQLTIEGHRLPAILVNVDSTRYLSPDSSYADTKAFYTVRPNFIITFTDDSYKQGEITAVRFESTFHRPRTIAAEINRALEVTRMANQTKSDFRNAFTSYTHEPNADNAKLFKSMFVSTRDTAVQVWTVGKNGVVKKERTRKVNQYTQNLKGAAVEIESMDEPQVSKPETGYEATVDFTQKIVRDTYCDRTKKRMYLVKDKDGNLKVAKIEVLDTPNNPCPCEQ